MDKEVKGELFIFSEAVLWSLFPILTVLSLSVLEPLFSLAVTTFFAFLFFAVVVTYKRLWSEIKNTGAIRDVLLTVLFIGVLLYTFFFWGLQFTSAGNASLIALMEVFFSFLFFNVFMGEYISFKQIVGAILMVLGAAIVLLPGVLGNFLLNRGDLLIMIGFMFAPIGNFFQRRARKTMSSEMMLLIRSFCTVPIVLLLAFLFGESFNFSGVRESFVYLVINGALLFGVSKIFWIEGIHRISVTKAISLSSISPLLTILFAYFFLKEVPTGFQLLSFIPLFLGVLLLTHKGGSRKVSRTTN